MKNNPNSRQKMNLHQKITDAIVELLETQTLSWDKPWVSLPADGKPAHNAVSKRVYSGINQIWLSLKHTNHNYLTNRWLTFKQIQLLDGAVVKGQKASEVFYSKKVWIDKNRIKYDEDQISLMSDAQKQELDIKDVYAMKYYYVFNVGQTINLPSAYYEFTSMPKLHSVAKDQAAEKLIKSTDAKIKYQVSDSAFYNYNQDTIYLPERNQFKGMEPYYQTTLHELAHWTGHFSRLNREMRNTAGSEKYAKEELVAELTSAYICSDLGFNKGITNNAAYIQSWLKALQRDNRYIFIASKEAEKASEFIRDLEKKRWSIDHLFCT